MAKGFMVRPAAQARKVMMQEWTVLRTNPLTGEIDEFEIICESGTFFATYRLLGYTDSTLSSDAAVTRFDPLTDDMVRELVRTWHEGSELRHGQLVTVEASIN
jgi:hypothetical protein